MSAQFTA